MNGVIENAEPIIKIPNKNAAEPIFDLNNINENLIKRNMMTDAIHKLEKFTYNDSNVPNGVEAVGNSGIHNTTFCSHSIEEESIKKNMKILNENGETLIDNNDCNNSNSDESKTILDFHDIAEESIKIKTNVFVENGETSNDNNDFKILYDDSNNSNDKGKIILVSQDIAEDSMKTSAKRVLGNNETNVSDVNCSPTRGLDARDTDHKTILDSQKRQLKLQRNRNEDDDDKTGILCSRAKKEHKFEGMEAVVELELVDVFSCTICNSAFLSFLELGNHIIMEHMDGAVVPLINLKIVTCDICNKSFPDRVQYHIHLIKHTQCDVKNYKQSYTHIADSEKYVKRYACRECDYKFVLESTLAAHGAVHRPMHACDCGVRYYRRSDLAAHNLLVHCTKPSASASIPAPINTSKPKTKRKNTENSVPSTKKTEGIHLARYNRVTCSVCDKTYSSRSNLHKHLLTHSGGRPYACTKCDKTFTQAGTLKVHLMRHSKVKDFICTQCNKGYYDKYSLDVHMRTHTGEKPYECPFCEKRFIYPSDYARHCRAHAGGKRYRCDACPKLFSAASSLNEHRKRHNNEKNFACSICDKKFYKKSHLGYHRVFHFKDKKFKCTICDKAFKLGVYLKRHMDRAHGARPRVQCDYCGGTFDCKVALEKHIKEHMYRVYKCERCNVKTFSRTKFEQHKCLQIECEFCSKVFHRKSAYNDHVLRKHTASYLCYCDHCGTQLQGKRNLARHIVRRHTTVKYKCERCLTQFISKHLLGEHIDRQKCKRR